MPRRILSLAVMSSLALVAVFSAPAECDSLGGAKVALHLQDRTAKGICDPPSEGGYAPYLVPLTQYVTAGEVGTSYNAYLVVAANAYTQQGMVGIAGVSCGIDYDPVPAQGVDVFDWVLCGDLEFTNAGPNGVWPAAGGGNRITYNIEATCPSVTVPGSEAEGYFTLFGAFYVYAYGDDDLRIIRNMNLQSGPELTVGDCEGSETDLPATAGGWITFSSDGTVAGCNPVLGPCDEFAPPPECLVTPDTLDFGEVSEGFSAYRTFTITNTGGGTLLGAVATGCGDFLVTGNAGAFALGEGQTRTITVRYSPTTQTATECQLSLGTALCTQVTCMGTGIEPLPPTCEVSASVLDFGNVPVGFYADRTFTITNIGTGTLSGWVDPGCEDFAVTAGSLYFDLGAGESRLVRVRFFPQTEGVISCSLTFGENNCGPVFCTGVGLPGALSECSVTPASLDFGEVMVGQSAERSFVIRNIGSTNLRGMVSRSCDYYGVVSGGGEYDLYPGESKTVVVRFSPVIEGTIECTLALFSTCSDVDMVGTGLPTPPPVCEVSADSLDFGEVWIGSHADRTFTITNTGDGYLTGEVPAGCGDFTVVSGYGAYSLGAGQSRTVGVRFVPATEGPATCLLDLTGIICPDVTCVGTGAVEPPPVCEVSTDSLDFGQVWIGTYLDRTFTITNTGAGSLTGDVPASCGDFTVVSGAGFYSLDAGQSRLVIVRFTPTTAGPTVCLLDLTGTACTDVTCLGTGTAVPDPICVVSVDSLDFGGVAVGGYADRTFTITNAGGGVLTGWVSPGCEDFATTAGSLAFALSAGQSRTVRVRFLPQTEGEISCYLTFGENDCVDVLCTGFGLPGALSECSVSPSSLDFGDVPIGSYADRSFTITNVGTTTLAGMVSRPCDYFGVLSGGGEYVLSPGEYRTVTVRFTPLVEGTIECTLGTYSVCSDVPMVGTGTPPPDCIQSTQTLDFGSVILGQVRDLTFTLTNTTASPLAVAVSEACNNFAITSGGGAVTLQPDTPHEVRVRFSPTAVTTYQCTIEIDGACSNVSATGQGQLGGGGSGLQAGAVVALHAQAHPQKGDDPCATDPVSMSLPCDDFDVQQALGVPTDLYLVVAEGLVSPGIGALTCGILYNNADIGGWTRNDGVGVDVLSWTQCSSGLQWPSGPTGLTEDEWPASGGGLRITWDSSIDCQRTVLGDNGVHAVAGSFYVYAYSNDVFQITSNNTVISGPEFQVGDCYNSLSDLPLSSAARVGFGSTWGYNPCDGGAVPVKLLSFTAERDVVGAVLHWKTGAAPVDHLGFEVYRGTENDGRELVSDGLLSGRTEYAFTDPAPPAGETTYWLAERSRTGEITWHGPAVLPAGITGGRLVLTQPPPNPFVTSTRFSFRLPEGGEVQVRIFDMAGREVARPFSGFLSPGEQVVEWNGRDARGRRLSAGAYLYLIETAQGSLSGKVIRLQ